MVCANVSFKTSWVNSLIKSGFEIIIQAGAGENAGFLDSEYESKGAKITSNREEILGSADILAFVRGYGANQVNGKTDLEFFKDKQTIIGITPFPGRY